MWRARLLHRHPGIAGPASSAQGESVVSCALPACTTLAATVQLALLGAAVGQATWAGGSGGPADGWRAGAGLGCLVALPLAWGVVSRRRDAFVLFAAYQLWSSRGVLAMLSLLPAHAGYPLACALWLASAAVAAAPWALLAAPGDATRAERLVRCLAAFAVVTLPPFGWFCPFDPALAAAGLFPGRGWTGLCAGTLLVASTAAWVRTRPARAMVMAAALVCLSALALSAETPAPNGWVGVSTRLGPLGEGLAASAARHEELVAVAQKAIEGGASLVVLPEDIAGPWSEAAAYWWREAAATAAARGTVLLVGTEWPMREHRFNTLRALGAVEGVAATAQIVAPVYWWMPWRHRGVGPDWGAGVGHFEFHGKRIAFSFCFEDVLPWPLLRAFAGLRRPDVIVSVVNHGWLAGASSIPQQEFAVRALARLFGVALIRAVNLPRHDGN